MIGLSTIYQQGIVLLGALSLSLAALAAPATDTRNLGVAQSGKRLALVIGNDAYQHVSKLEKAGNDATAMARELKAAGFEVLLHRDLNFKGMVKAVETLSNSITGGDQVVVFFAGHGVQIKSGSYLLPVDIEAGNESEVEKTAYGLNDLTDKLSEARASFALVIVDACRDNPLRSKGRSIGGTRGLSAIEPPKGQMVVYSASKGQQALDRLNDRDSNPNGVFTREFIARMKQPGVRIEELVRDVQDAVENLARTVSHEQRPAIYNEARGNFYFFGPTGVIAPPLAGDDPDMALWKAVELGGSADEYEIYLRQYPQGKFAALVPARTEKLRREAAAREAQEAARLQREQAVVAAVAEAARLRQEAERSAEIEKSRRGKLVIFRESAFVGSAVKIAVFVDGVNIGTLTSGSYVELVVLTGTRQIVARILATADSYRGECKKAVSINQDQQVFLKFDFNWSSECDFSPVKPDSGTQEISSLVRRN